MTKKYPHFDPFLCVNSQENIKISQREHYDQSTTNFPTGSKNSHPAGSALSSHWSVNSYTMVVYEKKVRT